jgi:hypothetical protein
LTAEGTEQYTVTYHYDLNNCLLDEDKTQGATQTLKEYYYDKNGNQKAVNVSTLQSSDEISSAASVGKSWVPVDFHATVSGAILYSRAVQSRRDINDATEILVLINEGESMKNNKVVLSFLSLVFAFVSFCLAFGSISSGVSKQLEFSNTEKPIYTVEAAVVDNEGMIYLYIPAFESLQIYDNTGRFDYRIALPGEFSWMVDENSHLNIVMRHSDGHYQHLIINNQTLLSDTVLEKLDAEEMVENFSTRNKKEYVDREGVVYKIESLEEKSITKWDSDGNFVARIVLRGPIFPLPFPFYTTLTLVGIAGFIFINPAITKVYKNLSMNPFKRK